MGWRHGRHGTEARWHGRHGTEVWRSWCHTAQSCSMGGMARTGGEAARRHGTGTAMGSGSTVRSEESGSGGEIWAAEGAGKKVEPGVREWLPVAMMSGAVEGLLPTPAVARRSRILSWASRMRTGSPLRTASSQSRRLRSFGMSGSARDLGKSRRKAWRQAATRRWVVSSRASSVEGGYEDGRRRAPDCRIGGREAWGVAGSMEVDDGADGVGGAILGAADPGRLHDDVVDEAGDDLAIVDGEGDGENVLGVADKASSGGTGVEVPEAEIAIPGTGEGNLTVGGEDHVLHDELVGRGEVDGLGSGWRGQRGGGGGGLLRARAGTTRLGSRWLMGGASSARAPLLPPSVPEQEEEDESRGGGDLDWLAGGGRVGGASPSQRRGRGRGRGSTSPGRPRRCGSAGALVATIAGGGGAASCLSIGGEVDGRG